MLLPRETTVGAALTPSHPPVPAQSPIRYLCPTSYLKQAPACAPAMQATWLRSVGCQGSDCGPHLPALQRPCGFPLCLASCEPHTLCPVSLVGAVALLSSQSRLRSSPGIASHHSLTAGPCSRQALAILAPCRVHTDPPEPRCGVQQVTEPLLPQITAVCNFFTYIRYIQQGLVRQDGERPLVAPMGGPRAEAKCSHYWPGVGDARPSTMAGGLLPHHRCGGCGTGAPICTG